MGMNRNSSFCNKSSAFLLSSWKKMWYWGIPDKTNILKERFYTLNHGLVTQTMSSPLSFTFDDKKYKNIYSQNTSKPHYYQVKWMFSEFPSYRLFYGNENYLLVS